MTSESHNTRLSGIKQDTKDFKSNFNSLDSEANITEKLNQSIMSIKDSINYCFKR